MAEFLQPYVVIGGIVLLLWLILRVKMPAFLALLLVSMLIGLGVGLGPAQLLKSVQSGMGGTLGFVAVVVGLGAMFGALLELSGGVQALSRGMLKAFGTSGAPWALGGVGFLVAIPVFFDVALIILAPVLYGLAKGGKYSIVYYALPLIAGLGVTHAFIPPTPGPIAVAQLLEADLGLVIYYGFLTGLPAMIVAGPLYAWMFWKKESTPEEIEFLDSVMVHEDVAKPVGLWAALFAVLLPLILILTGTGADKLMCLETAELPCSDSMQYLKTALIFIGHPFTALIIAVLYVYVVFGIMRGDTTTQLQDAMTKALEPAGIVILITGAGGVLKQVLIDSGVGAMLANQVGALPPLVFAFVVALLVRVAQGSTTVAMITGAGLAAPVVQLAGLDANQTALAVLAVAAGAIAASHVNDSGFWLVSRYLGLSEAKTLKSWTVASCLIGVTGFIMTLILSQIV